MAPNRPASQNKYTPQNIGNTSFDEDFGVQTHQPLGYDGQSLQRMNADALATKVTVVGNDTYVGIAKPGTAQSTAKWQCQKVNVNGGTTIITWADGDEDFNNVATDLTALTYS